MLLQSINLSCKELYLLINCLKSMQEKYPYNRYVKGVLNKVEIAFNNEYEKIRKEHNGVEEFKREYEMYQKLCR